ncbi:MAG: response regulator [Desulfovermiculus sp.]
MKIYSKILLITLPLIILTALLVGSVTYRVAREAMFQAVQDNLRIQLDRAVAICGREIQGGSADQENCMLAAGQSRISEILKRVRFGSTGHVFVMDRSGTVVLHPDQSMVGTKFGTRGWFTKMLDRDEGQIRFVLDGKEYWGAYIYFAPWSWFIVSSGQESELAGPIQQMGVYTLILALLSLLLATVPLLILARRITAPIKALIAGTDQIRQGDLTTHIPITSSDETGILAGAFNVMTTRLRTLITALEENNKQLRNEVAERKQTEKALKESERNYRSIFENALEGIFQSTLDGRFIRVSPSFARMFGYSSPEEMISSVTDIAGQLYADPRDRHEFADILARKGMVDNYAVPLRRKDGTIFWGMEWARAIPDDHGTIERIEGFCLDVTAQKTAEEQKERLEEQLLQSQKMEALGTLAGGITHDFNNLLQVMSANIQMLLRKKEHDPDYKYLAEVDRAVTRAGDLVRQLLTFSRKTEVKLQEVNLNEILQDTANMLERTIPKMISLEIRTAPDLYRILADPLHMEQVLVNLATNAVAAMESGGRLIIETENYSADRTYGMQYLDMPPGEYVLLKVTDTGKGMSQAVRKRIFEPFFTTKEVGKGTGLGLSMVYGIVKSHKGIINCYSEPGKGTTFKMYFPAVAGSGGEEASAPAKSLEKAPAGGNETVLLVDDEELILEITREYLTQWGYTVLTAFSGESALELFKTKHQDIDLIIMDLGMPGMGGERCLEALRALQPEVKVIVASGYGTHKIALHPEKFGAAGFLGKPYRVNELLLKIREILDAANLGPAGTNGSPGHPD